MDTLEPEKNKTEIFNIPLWSKWLRDQFDNFIKKEPYHLDDGMKEKKK